jgi:hypothetical protein
MKITLERRPDDGVATMGIIYIRRSKFYTLERPWIKGPEPGGLPGRSCIPLGVYQLELHDSELHPKTFAMVNEKLGITHYGSPRAACLIHPANYPSELRGCIAPGLFVGQDCILQSRDAYNQLMAMVPWTLGHTLEITEA